MASQFLFNSYSFLIDVLFISYWFPIQFLCISYSCPIHSSSFHFQSLSKIVIRKWKEMKWSERRGKESKRIQRSNPKSPIHLPIQNPEHSDTFRNKESIANKESLLYQLENTYSLYSIVEGGVINHFEALLTYITGQILGAVQSAYR